MLRYFRISLFACLALLGCWGILNLLGGQKAPLAPEPYYPRIAKMVANVLPEAHLERLPMGETVSSNALSIFLSSLDYDHTFFLASDVAAYEQEAPALGDRLRKGDTAFAFEVFNTFKERVSNRCDYVKQVLGKGFDLDVEETYGWKRKDAAWPADEAEWNEVWRKKLKNEYVSRVVAQKLAEENAAKAAATNQQAAASTNPPPVAATNLPVGAVTNAAAAAGTNATAEGKEAQVDEDARDAKLTPEEFILKRYKQFLTVLDDSDSEWVLQKYLSSFAQAYDPHSDYMSASTAEDFDIGMKLSLFGIGALLSPEDGAAKVERVIPGGPADRDGRLKAGDKIIAVAQDKGPSVDILHWPLRKIVQLIRGEKGTRVVITVIPASDLTGTRTVKIDLIREEVKLEEQAAKGTVHDVTGADGVKRKLGVIVLPAFYVDISGKMEENRNYRSSVRDMRVILTDMTEKGVQGVIVDLRNNGGGSLAEAVEMTGLFLPSGPVVQVKERRGVQILSDPDTRALYTGPLIVLVNRQSASASEILAAALQDYGRAVIVGDSKTHGKGTVQSLMSLDRRDPQMGSLKITAASFYRIAGGSTQLKGVVPDIVIPSALDVLEIGEEYLPHALPWTTVAAVPYRPVADLAPLIGTLRERSERRRSESPRFKAEKELLDRIRTLQAAREISLNLKDRLRMAKTERSLSDLEKVAEEPSEPKKNADSDIILAETLSILADMVELQKPMEKPRERPLLENAWSR